MADNKADNASSATDGADTVGAESGAPSDASGVAPLDKPEKKVDGALEPSTCSTCKKPVNAENSVVLMGCAQKQPLARRCKACHSLRSRINRVTSKFGALAEDWTKVSEQEKQEFYKKYQDLAGEGLLTRLQETIVESKRNSTSVTFEGTGEYFDEMDMNEKYKNKPEQLANIFANTRNYFCPVRQVWLYEDVKYKRIAQDTEEVSRVDKRKRQMIPKDQAGNQDSAGSSKKGKKQLSTVENPNMPKLKSGEKKKILKKIEALTTKRLHLMDQCAKAKSEKLKALVPAYVLEAADKTIDEALAFSSKVEETLAKEYGDSKEIMEIAEKHLEALAEGGTRVKCQVEQALAFISEKEE